MLKIVTVDIDNVRVLVCCGRITLGENTSTLRDTIRGCLAQGHKHILLDLCEVGYMDNSGIGELVSSYSRAANSGGSLKLCRLNERHKKILQITKLYTVFDCFDDVDSGVRSFT